MRRCYRRAYGNQLFDAALIPCIKIYIMGELLQTYWAEVVLALMAFVKVIVNLTPTEADNKVFGWLDTLINAIVNDRRKERREARKND